MLRDTLNAGRFLLMDGAMGTELQKAGARAGECFSLWNLTHPEVVQSIHHAYVQAGAEILLTNTFQANPYQLERQGLLDQGKHIASAAIELARSAGGCWVLGDIGPMQESPNGSNFPRREAVQIMVDWLTGVDGLILETCSDASVFQAVRWIRDRAPEVPIFLAMTYREDERKGIVTWDGLVPEQIAEHAAQAGVDVLGVNCGLNLCMDKIVEIVHRYRNVCDLPLFARPNAGTPIRENDAWIYPLTPQVMAEKLLPLKAAGASLVGGCCGTTPDHIRALKGNPLV